MTPDEYIIKSGEELKQVDNPLGFLVDFYCNINGISKFKGIYPSIGKLINQHGEGIIYRAIVKNYYKGKPFNKSTYYKDILFTAIGIKKEHKLAEEQPTSMTYTDYLKLRESVNV